jgi:hypothetical protein
MMISIDQSELLALEFAAERPLRLLQVANGRVGCRGSDQ